LFRIAKKKLGTPDKCGLVRTVGGYFNILATKENMKTTITMIAAFAAFTAGAVAAPVVTTTTTQAEVVAADEKTTVLAVTGLR
jgi:hypothetical protein